MSDAQLPLILIVDDSATTRAMIKRIVNMAEPVIARMIEAPNGAEGLRLLRENKVDVVFADLNMPVMDGFAMIEAMRGDEQLSSIPVVVISAQPDPQAVEKLKSQGVAAYLPKPFKAEDVHSIVGPLLEAAAKVAIDPATAALNDLVPNALAEALETMAFISPEPLETAQPMADDTRIIRVHFKGSDAEGSLAIAASPTLGMAMTGNLDLTEASAADDALKELANITCGLMLRMRPGGAAGFQLDPPQMFDLAAGKSLFKGDAIKLSADGELITAQVVSDAAFAGM